MLNKLFFSKKAHRILTALFLFGMYSIFNNDKVPVVALIFGTFYSMFYMGYFVIRFIWRIFNKPDGPSEYEKDKMNGMNQNDLMDKYGVYRY